MLPTNTQQGLQLHQASPVPDSPISNTKTFFYVRATREATHITYGLQLERDVPVLGYINDEVYVPV
jgi:hypothetical protein